MTRMLVGQTRQYGNFSFSRVYESGHEVPAYQPETAYRIFMRSLGNRDVATGKVDTSTNGSYATVGRSDTWAIKNKSPKQPLHFCYTLDPNSLCTEAQLETVESGNGTVEEWILVDKNSTMLFPGVVGRRWNVSRDAVTTVTAQHAQQTNVSLCNLEVDCHL